LSYRSTMNRITAYLLTAIVTFVSTGIMAAWVPSGLDARQNAVEDAIRSTKPAGQCFLLWTCGGPESCNILRFVSTLIQNLLQQCTVKKNRISVYLLFPNWIVF
jgi:hypothetical protein